MFMYIFFIWSNWHLSWGLWHQGCLAFNLNTESISLWFTQSQIYRLIDCFYNFFWLSPWFDNHQAKYEHATRPGSTIKVITPDWFSQCVSANTRVPEDRYHPRLLILTPPPAPTPSPPPVKLEPVPIPSSEDYGMQSLDGQFQSLPPREVPLQPTLPLGPHGKPLAVAKTESSRTREALAMLVNSRLQASAKLEPPFDQPKVNPQVAAAASLAMRPGIPAMQTSKSGKPQQSGSQPNSPRTLQNITNRTENKSPSRQKVLEDF